MLLIKTILFFLKVLFGSIDFLVPKRYDYIAFGSNGGKAASGNALSLYEYLKNDKELKCKYYIRKKNKFLSSYSFSELIFFFRAKIVVITHGEGDFNPLAFSKRKIVINLFHGVPTKGMGYAEKIRTKAAIRNAKNGKSFDYFLCSSKIAAHNINYCINGNKIIYLLCGQPRNDRFFKTDKLRLHKHFSIQILYAPTWKNYKQTDWFPYKNLNLKALNDFLTEHNAAIYLRPHVNEKPVDLKQFLHSNIKILSFNDYPDINEFLLQTDCLITDYSSIYNDFILMDKPVIFLHHDIDEYLTHNSLLFGKNNLWYPGSKPKNEKEFINAISKIVLTKDDGYKKERQLVNRLFHTYEKGDSCKKISQFIKSKSFPKSVRETEL